MTAMTADNSSDNRTGLAAPIPRIGANARGDASAQSLISLLRQDADRSQAVSVQRVPAKPWKPFAKPATQAPAARATLDAMPQQAQPLAAPASASMQATAVQAPKPLVLNDPHFMAATSRPMPVALTSGDAWSTLPDLYDNSKTIDPHQVQMVLAHQDARVVRIFDDLRTQLLTSMQSEPWRRIAVTGPTSGCGASFAALQLALSLSRIPDQRTVLMDLNQRNPALTRQLRISRESDMAGYLRGEISMRDHLVKFSSTLALGLNTAPADRPSEMLHMRRSGEVLDAMIADLDPHLVIYDMPAMLEHDDLAAFLPQLDGVLLVADATKTLAPQIEECERRLSGKTPLLGVVLNRARRLPGTSVAA